MKASDVMWIANTIDDCRNERRKLAGTLALVPTMGALHEGHIALVRAAHQLADHVVVSIFVNPTQFGPNEDYTRYPRPIEDDLEKCRDANVTGVLNPTVDEMYPPDDMACEINVPALASILEGEHRPTHFAGVCRVVTKLFNIVQPQLAIFGRKDYQQLKVIAAMTRDQAMPIDIIGHDTVREGDGLALSSRNAYLDESQRERGLALHKALREARHMIIDEGETDPAVVEHAMNTILRTHKVEPDYAVVRHPQTLSSIDCIEPALTDGVVALIAARVDDIRLIDNMVIGESDET